jgi:Asp-tRNA(Asn)/Glu-tRNA(Gln) amidotransferase A subunit family amidase
LPSLNNVASENLAPINWKPRGRPLLVCPLGIAKPGIPGLAIPCDQTNKGLPLGFQLMGARFSEATLFKLGKLYQEAIDWKPKVAF